MKNLLIILVLISSYIVNGQDSEKLSKKEKKELKKQAKMYKSDPSKLKALNNQMVSLQRDLNSARQEATSSKQEVTSLTNRVEQLESQLEQAKAQKVEVNRREKAAPKEAVSTIGLAFKVQIGGFRKRDLTAFNDSQEDLVKVEMNEKGIQEIALGSFDSYQKANEFKKHLRAMGLKDSWIVPYQDGNRVPLKDVVDQLDLK